MKFARWPGLFGQRRHVLAASVGALIASGGFSGAALGQDDDESSAADDGDTERVIVTGTRIRRDDFSAVNATTVITAEDMERLGVVSVADMVNQLPGNVASVSPEATADSPFYLGASVANLRGLNTAFGVRTLTLLDSRRVTPTNNGGGVDLNFIPSALVGQIETVTGGASATYGADAMAGVVNVILDTNIEGLRVDANYYSTADGDADQYTVSLGTGFELFNSRGSLTIGLDSSRQDGIEDCTTLAVCQRGLGLLRNGQQENGGTVLSRYSLRDPIPIPGQPEWVIQEGHRYSVTPQGIVSPSANGSTGYPCATWIGGSVTGNPADVDTSGCVDSSDYQVGWYRFTPDGSDLVPYFTAAEVNDQELGIVDNVGEQTGVGFNFQGDGNRWSSPYGFGKNIYEGVPVRPSTDRDNLFARFTYELEGGIELGADLTMGQTRSESFQNSARNNLQQFCVMPANAYIQPDFAGPTLLAVYEARAEGGFATDNWFSSLGQGETGCRQAPFLGGTAAPRDDEVDVPRYDFAPGMEVHKDFSSVVDRQNVNDSKSMSLTLTANGDLFDGGSWTWDSYLQFGQTENRQSISSWRAGRRWDMALDSVIDGYDTNGDPIVECSVNAQNAFFDDNQGNLVNWGDFIRDRWQDYLYQALADDVGESQLDTIFEQYRNGCVPFNPFGSQPLTPEQQAYVFPRLFEGTDNDQTAFSVSFSGDAWRGIGQAGAMAMAAGFDWRENDTQNIADPNRFLGADFNFVGNSNSPEGIRRIYGDNWWGRTTTEEAWVEFDLPLLIDMPAADFLSINTSFRRSRNSTRRISGLESVTATDSTREVDSWKASLLWQPIDMMRVRMTRSADTRAPSANELFATNSFATETGGELETATPWRFGYDTPGLTAENVDRFIVVQAGNSSLENERSITETLGFVFQPAESIPGLSVSIDYYQTTIEGGIRDIDFEDTISACGSELGISIWQERIPNVPEENWQICNNLVFGEPDGQTPEQLAAQGILPGDPDYDRLLGQAVIRPGSTVGGGIFGGDEVLDENGDPLTETIPNPFFAWSNVVSVAESTINEEDLKSRGIDYSVSYFTQLGGGGSINGRALFTRYLEQQVFLINSFGPQDVSGQTGGNNIANYFGTFSVNYSPTPRIRGNLFLTYAKNAFSMTAQLRYTGTGKLNKQNGWLSPGDQWSFQQYLNGSPVLEDDSPGIEIQTQAYDPDVERTVTNNYLPSWTTMNLNFNYDFGRSRFQLDNFESLNAYFNIENVGDRIPTFFSGTGAGGINTSLYSALGRSYRVGVRMQF